MQPRDPVPVAEIQAARERLAGVAVRTPLVRLNAEGPGEIWLKLENLQPIGSFKIRGAGNAMAALEPSRLADGVYTASAGNMAQGVAWNARRRGIPCRVVVPEHAPRTKLEAIRRMGGEVIALPFDEWWQVIVDHGRQGVPGHFIHPVSDPSVMAGNATIGLEILEDLPRVDAVIVPYGGGGLSCGIASAIRARSPGTRVYAAEVDTAAPLSVSLAAGGRREADYRPSFVDGIGSRTVLAEMWPLARSILDGSLVVGLDEVAGAIRLLVERNRVVAEGAAATSVAAALAGRAGNGTVVCVVSGGNLDTDTLVRILRGEVP